MPFAKARTALCYGERLRRDGRRVQARVQLRAAIQVFERLAAAPWIDRAAGELRATGETARTRKAPASEALTAQELQIATAGTVLDEFLPAVSSTKTCHSP